MRALLKGSGLRSAEAFALQSSCLSVLLGLAGVLAGEASPSRFEFTEPHMGTQARVVLYARSRAEAERASRAAFARIGQLDAALSDYRSDSELMGLVRSAGQGPVPVSRDLFKVLAHAQELAARSDGAFDVTAGALTRLWRGARRLGELPSAERVARARQTSGFRFLHLKEAPRTAELGAGVMLDVGGIAKGFAADEALAILAQHGMSSALVALGGDMAMFGPPPGRAAWTIDIAGLKVPGAPILEPLPIVNGAVSTSGDAEQWMEVAGVRYSHILDPRSGWPLTGRSSVTVIARTGMEADGLATALAVLDLHAGRQLVDETSGAAAIWVRERDGRVTVQRSSRWPTVGEEERRKKEEGRRKSKEQGRRDGPEPRTLTALNGALDA
jgi:FAD:protein FMN transferase